MEVPTTQTVTLTVNGSEALPIRKGIRPNMICEPAHIQLDGRGNPKYLHHLVDEVRGWPYVQLYPPFAGNPDTFSFRLEEMSIAADSSAFITDREFARVLMATPTIYVTLPLVCAHWAIVRRWAEPHFLSSHGVMPPGVVVLYTPRDQEELEVCYFLFSESYCFARKVAEQTWAT
jgi:hypothetical protein